jgi:hypothetical protein
MIQNCTGKQFGEQNHGFERYYLSYYKTLRNGALAPPERFGSRQPWMRPNLSGASKHAAGFPGAFSQRSEWLTLFVDRAKNANLLNDRLRVSCI